MSENQLRKTAPAIGKHCKQQKQERRRRKKKSALYVIFLQQQAYTQIPFHLNVTETFTFIDRIILQVLDINPEWWIIFYSKRR